MAAIAWIMVALAIWHFTIFLPDRFWGGIVGAFVGAVIGGFLFGYFASGLEVPGRVETDIATTLLGAPGAVIGLAVTWALGVRAERASTPAA